MKTARHNGRGRLGPSPFLGGFALALALIVMAGSATAALAWTAPETSYPTIPITWDGRTIAMSWDGRTLGTATGTLIGANIAIPGESVMGSALVENAGPGPARLTIEIRDVKATYPSNDSSSPLEDIIHLFWDFGGQTDDVVWREARLAQDDAGVSYTTMVTLSQGEQLPLRVGFYFPEEETGGQNDDGNSPTLSFGLRLTMTDESQADVTTGGTGVQRVVGLVALVLVALGILGLGAARIMRRRASVAQR